MKTSHLLSLGIIFITAQGKAASVTQDLAEGAKVYKTSCLICHGENYDGKGDAGKFLKPLPRNLVTEAFKNGDSLDQIITTLKTGLAGTAMQGFASTLSEDQIKNVAAFTKSLRRK